MPERNEIEQLVTSAVARVLESHIPGLRDDLVRRVLDELQPQLGHVQPPAASGVADLLPALAAIQSGSTQKEILRALLEGTAGYCERAALFVVKAGAATGWHGRGFANDDEISNFALDTSGGVAYEALHSRIPAQGSTSEMDPEFLTRFNAPRSHSVAVLPLLLKDKVAALVYVDAGQSESFDGPALELLVKSTSAWLEVALQRKQSHKDTAPEAAESSETSPVAVQAVSSFADPFAGHAPHHAAPAVVAAPVAVPVAAMAAAAPASVTVVPQMSAEDAEIHRKAQRFARLLMDEIKLYNQAKVAEGRKNRDLYDRLKEDIEKSRATFRKRYGNTAAANTDYFSQEIVRSLAEDDASLMGANFRG